MFINKKSLFSLLTAFVLCVTMVLVPVSAAEVSPTVETIVETTGLVDVDESVFNGFNVSEEPKDDADTEVNFNPFVSAFAASSAAASYDNTTPDSALFVNTNVLITDYITVNWQDRWYYCYANAGKITLYLDYAATNGIDYAVRLYKFNANNGTINQIDVSRTQNGSYEQTATIVEDGYYFIAVESWQGYDTVNPFYLYLLHSAAGSYDAYEADDTPATAKTLSTTFSHTGTFDNMCDTDWKTFTITSARYLNMA